MMMKSIQDHAEETKQQLEQLMKQQRQMSNILKAFPDCVIVALENGHKGYASSNVDHNAKGAHPQVFLNTLQAGPGRYFLRYAVDFSGTKIYSKATRPLSSAEVTNLLNQLLPTKAGKEAAQVLTLPRA